MAPLFALMARNANHFCRIFGSQNHIDRQPTTGENAQMSKEQHQKPKPEPEQPPSPDKIKLEIRDEVEKRFEHPPKALSDLIEAEVQKRIKRQEYYYLTILGIVLVAATAFCLTLWHVQLSEIPSAVQKQLADESAIEAKKQIMAILAYSEVTSNVLSDYTKTMSQQKSAFDSAWMLNIAQAENANAGLSNRLNEIKQQDNVLLKSDIEKLYVHESISNFGGSSFELKYEPIPMTVIAYVMENNTNPGTASLNFMATGDFYVVGNKITFASPKGSNSSVLVEYVRKSL